MGLYKNKITNINTISEAEKYISTQQTSYEEEDNLHYLPQSFSQYNENKNNENYQNIELKPIKICYLSVLKNPNIGLIINTINKNRDIGRKINEKTDRSDTEFCLFLEQNQNEFWNFNEEVKKDIEELDNNKIEELINFLQNCRVEDFNEFDKSYNDMNHTE